MTMVKIKSIRLSFIWVDVIPSVLEDLNPTAALAWLGRRGDFIERFNHAQRVRANPLILGDLSVPWRSPESGRKFWRHYFENKHPDSIAGRRAWHNLTPLRQDLVRHAAKKDAYSDLNLSAYYFSHGMALVLTLNLRGQSLDIMDAAKSAMNLRHNQVLSLPDEPDTTYSLDVLGNAKRDAIREAQFAKLEHHPGRRQPFSIVTVLEADDIDSLTHVYDGDDTHRALEAMTGWNPQYELMDLANTPIDSARTEGQQQLDTDLAYMRPTGVAVWLPRALQSGKDGRSSLSCYHNNLLHGSLQTRSLAEFVHQVKSKEAEGAVLSNAVTNRARRANTLVGMIKAGKLETYRSRCLEKQVEQALGGD